jgi:hypothetical protein
LNEKSNYSPAQAREIGFDRNAYAPAAEGEFMGVLVMKVYGDFCIRCYFETADGEKVKLTAWQNRLTGQYGPRGSGIDFKNVPLQTIWHNRVGQSRTGALTWVAAEESGVLGNDR